MSKILAIGRAALLIGTMVSVGQAADRPAQSGAPANLRAFPALTVIYKAAGVRDSGSAENAGTATTTHCTNTSGASQRIRYVVRNFNGAVVADAAFTVGAITTRTVSTHGTVLVEDLPFLSPGVAIAQGVITIYATAASVICTIQVLDASTGVSVGDLHLVRFNSIADTQE